MIRLQAPRLEDKDLFLKTMQKSQILHAPFIVTPFTAEEYQIYLEKSIKDSEHYFFAWQDEALLGVFNISGIVYGAFKSAYLWYYVSIDHAGKGLMSHALKLVLKEIFTTLDLHRIEANIQPTNTASIHLVTANDFLKEGYSSRYLKINGVWQDHVRFALTYEHWSKNQE